MRLIDIVKFKILYCRTAYRTFQIMFCTVLRNLKSPQNVGSIIRSHVALGGGSFIILGQSKPWQFKKGTQAFSRKLETICDITYFEHDDEFFKWCADTSTESIAIEISESASSVSQFIFPRRTAIIVGNDATGLPDNFVSRCDYEVYIPQFGPVGSLNVAIACSIAMFEYAKIFNRPQLIAGHKFVGEAKENENYISFNSRT